jgi:hypothetical protein
LPLWPFGVCNADGNWATLSETVTNATRKGHFILLELHAGAATITKATTSERVLHLTGSNRDASRQSF